MRSWLEAWLTQQWYARSPGWLWLLFPLEGLFAAIVALRQRLYQRGILPVTTVPVPVIVVGNIVAGGAGKTPVIAALARMLSDSGYRPGIVSRGYGREGRELERVTVDAPVRRVGDEPLMLARETGVPVVVSAQRAQAAEALIKAGCDVVLADDGLQHYLLGRDIEVAVIPGARYEGNGHLIPLGPLREPAHRLQRCDLRVVVNGPARPGEFALQGRPGQLLPLGSTGATRRLSEFAGKEVLAIAGIAHPDAFFATLRAAGLKLQTRRFPDHHHFCAEDLADADKRPVIMTSKDAVKCDFVSGREVYALEYTVDLPEELKQALLEKIRAVSVEKKVRFSDVG